MELMERITSDPKMCHGKPVIRGKRYPVSLILDLLGAGMTRQEILDDYEDLEDEDITACLVFAAKILQGQRIVPLAA
jgi:uncharacterized protein (DUF433 family)